MSSLKTARNKYRKAFIFSLKNKTQSFLYSFELKFEKRIDIHFCNILSSEINFKPICWNPDDSGGISNKIEDIQPDLYSGLTMSTQVILFILLVRKEYQK